MKLTLGLNWKYHHKVSPTLQAITGTTRMTYVFKVNERFIILDAASKTNYLCPQNWIAV